MNKVIINPGDRFGQLTVIEFVYKKYNRCYWRCLCDCGEICETAHYYVKRRKHCNNPRHKSSYKEGYGDITNNFWNRIILGAKKRDLEFNITIKEMWELYLKQDKKCAISGIPITFRVKTRGTNGTCSLDRINSNGGYTLNNVQWVHKNVNNMKQTLTDEKFISWCKIISFNSNKNCLVSFGPSYKDERGTINMILEKCEINSISIITSKENTSRASHWHKLDSHYCLLDYGEIEYYERPVGSNDKPKLTIIKEGQLFFTPPYTEHQMIFTKDSKFHCFSTLSRDNKNYESETVRFNFSLKNIYDNWGK